MANIKYNIKATGKNGAFTYVRKGADMSWSFKECKEIITLLAGKPEYVGVLFEMELA